MLRFDVCKSFPPPPPPNATATFPRYPPYVNAKLTLVSTANKIRQITFAKFSVPLFLLGPLVLFPRALSLPLAFSSPCRPTAPFQIAPVVSRSLPPPRIIFISFYRETKFPSMVPGESAGFKSGGGNLF